MTRRERLVWAVVLVTATLLLLWSETRSYAQCRTQYSVAQCEAWLVY